MKNLDLEGLSFFVLIIFVFCIPFQKRIEFIHPDTFRFGTFIDYTTVLFYIVDTILIAALLLFIFGKLLKKQNPVKILSSRYAIFLLVFILLLLPSLVVDHSPVALSFLAQLVVASLFSYFVYHFSQDRSKVMFFLYALFLSGIFQSLIAISQFITQKSLDIWFLGESPYTVSSLNVAKIFVNDTIFVRAYGTFPHPNVLAAFLVISLSVSVVLLFIRRAHIVNSILKTLLWSLFFLLQFVGLLFTFSRSGWLMAIPSVMVITIYIFYQNERNERNESIKLKLRTVLVILAVASCFILWLSRSFIMSRAVVADNHGDNALSERALLLSVSRETISQNWIVGTGLHTFLHQIELYSQSQHAELQNWQYQPVHNVYFLLLSETGIVGFGGFIVLLVFVFGSALRSYKKQPAEIRVLLLFSSSGVLSYLLTGLIDHHPWDMHQSLLTFFLLCGLIAGVSNSKSVSRETP